MRGFKLNETGDVVMENGAISFVRDGDLLAQTVRTVVNTNRGEWFLDESEGVDFAAMLGKRPDEGFVRDDIQRALLSVDDTLVIGEYSQRMEGRTLKVEFEAVNAEGQSVSVKR